MRFLVAATVLLCLAASSLGSAAQAGANSSTLTSDEVRMVSPALEQYTQRALLGDLWQRPGLSPRDRSIVTVAALIARNQTIEMSSYLNRALDAGVKPGEISEIIAH